MSCASSGFLCRHAPNRPSFQLSAPLDIMSSDSTTSGMIADHISLFGRTAEFVLPAVEVRIPSLPKSVKRIEISEYKSKLGYVQGELRLTKTLIYTKNGPVAEPWYNLVSMSFGTPPKTNDNITFLTNKVLQRGLAANKLITRYDYTLINPLALTLIQIQHPGLTKKGNRDGVFGVVIKLFDESGHLMWTSPDSFARHTPKVIQ